MTLGEVVDQLVDYAQDMTGGLFFQHLKQQVATNPLPVAVRAAGFAWLMFGKGVSASKIGQRTASVTDKGRSWLSDDAAGMAATPWSAYEPRQAEQSEHAAKKRPRWRRAKAGMWAISSGEIGVPSTFALRACEQRLNRNRAAWCGARQARMCMRMSWWMMMSCLRSCSCAIVPS
jgi:hypothetical protein